MFKKMYSKFCNGKSSDIVGPNSGNRVYYNGLYFRNQADAEDYKNANGLK